MLGSSSSSSTQLSFRDKVLGITRTFEHSFSEVADPSAVIALFDGPIGLNRRDETCLPIWKQSGCESIEGIRTEGFTWLSHFSGFNSVFLDGHVKRQTKSHWQQWVYDPRDPDARALFENNPNLADP